MQIPIRSLVLVASLLAAAGGGVWAWQAWRHARLDLVTLRVRNEPLASVIRRMERQTRESIALDSRLDARVTLDLDGVPLADALQEVAERIGGLARATYAVFERRPALDRLAALIRAGTAPESAGWTNLSGSLGPSGMGADALQLDELPAEVREALARGDKQVRVLRDGGHEGGSGTPGEPGWDRAPGEAAGPSGSGQRRMEVVEDVIRGGPEPAVGGRRGERAGRSSPSRRVLVRASGETVDGEGGLREFDLSPERLLLETRLVPALAGGTNDAVRFGPAAGAPEIARRVRGQWARLFTLERSPVPHLPGLRTMTGSVTGPPPGPGANLSELAASEVRRGQYERLQRLTPEQRARAAGEGAVHEPSR